MKTTPTKREVLNQKRTKKQTQRQAVSRKKPTTKTQKRTKTKLDANNSRSTCSKTCSKWKKGTQIALRKTCCIDAGKVVIFLERNKRRPDIIMFPQNGQRSQQPLQKCRDATGTFEKPRRIIKQQLQEKGTTEEKLAQGRQTVRQQTLAPVPPEYTIPDPAFIETIEDTYIKNRRNEAERTSVNHEPLHAQEVPSSPQRSDRNESNKEHSLKLPIEVKLPPGYSIPDPAFVHEF